MFHHLMVKVQFASFSVALSKLKRIEKRNVKRGKVSDIASHDREIVHFGNGSDHGVFIKGV